MLKSLLSRRVPPDPPQISGHGRTETETEREVRGGEERTGDHWDHWQGEDTEDWSLVVVRRHSVSQISPSLISRPPTAAELWLTTGSGFPLLVCRDSD